MKMAILLLLLFTIIPTWDEIDLPESYRSAFHASAHTVHGHLDAVGQQEDS